MRIRSSSQHIAVNQIIFVYSFIRLFVSCYFYMVLVTVDPKNGLVRESNN